jgi:ATP-dependent DNA ligase
MNYNELFNILAAESSSKKKIEILTRYKKDETLKSIIESALDPFINYYIRKIPEYKHINSALDLQWGIESLRPLSDRVYTGNAGIDWLQGILEQLLPEDAKVIERIIARDLQCGVSISTVNKIWPKLIHEFPTMLCSPFNKRLVDNIEFPAIVQKKEDGMRVNVIVRNGTVGFYSRNGKPIDLLGKLEYEFLEIANRAQVVYDGELLVNDCDRKTGNGILNRAIKGTITNEEASKVYVVLWDRIPYDDFLFENYNVPYSTRLHSLYADLVHSSEKIRSVETYIVSSLEQTEDLFSQFLAKGAEGIILKDMNSIWQNTRSRKQIKFKGEEECDLRCIGVEEGKGKYVGMIGGLYCESGDGKLSVTVGSGLNDEQRKLDPENYIGKIITVKYNQRITNKQGGESLFLPIFVEVRLDKNIADSIRMIK